VETSKEFVVVAWDAPESDGGSPITKYKVEKRDATRAAYIQAEEVDGKTLKAKVTKLTEGNKYFFQVAAENEVGLSDWTETTEPVEAKMPFGIIFYSYTFTQIWHLPDTAIRCFAFPVVHFRFRVFSPCSLED